MATGTPDLSQKATTTSTYSLISDAMTTTTSTDTSSPLKRGYSMVQLNNACRVKGTSIHSNVLIKKSLPARGLVSSNPLRIDRLLQNGKETRLLRDIKVHTDSGWGIKIWTCSLPAELWKAGQENIRNDQVEAESLEIFVGVTPMGSTGSGFCFWEMFAAQAQAIIRVGANDQSSNPKDIVVCSKADNLVNLPHAAGDLDVTRQTIFPASSILVDCLKARMAQCFDTSTSCVNPPAVKLLPVHHVEDFHAYNFSECLPDQGSHIIGYISRLRRKSNGECCWDMESAALFYRAQQYGLHAATVLLPIAVVDGEAEAGLYRSLFQALADFSPSAAVAVAPPLCRSMKGNAQNTSSRSLRRFSTNDIIGTEDALFGMIDDPEVGNGLFVDESERGPSVFGEEDALLF